MMYFAFSIDVDLGSSMNFFFLFIVSCPVIALQPVGIPVCLSLSLCKSHNVNNSLSARYSVSFIIKFIVCVFLLYCGCLFFSLTLSLSYPLPASVLALSVGTSVVVSSSNPAFVSPSNPPPPPPTSVTSPSSPAKTTFVPAGRNRDRNAPKSNS